MESNEKYNNYFLAALILLMIADMIYSFELFHGNTAQSMLIELPMIFYLIFRLYVNKQIIKFRTYSFKINKINKINKSGNIIVAIYYIALLLGGVLSHRFESLIHTTKNCALLFSFIAIVIFSFLAKKISKSKNSL